MECIGCRCEPYGNDNPVTVAMVQESRRTHAGNILVEADKLTGNGGDRNDSYDHPRVNFGKIAEVWTVLLREKLKGPRVVPQGLGMMETVGEEVITPRDVARLMIGMKLVRDTHKAQRDNILDIAGYARCAERLEESE